jgi:hypothetical protein
MIKLQQIYQPTLKKLTPSPRNIDRLLMASWLIALTIALSLLSGCSYLKTQQKIPDSLTIACQDAQVFEGNTLRDLMNYTTDILEQYHVCKARMDAVVQWADRA